MQSVSARIWTRVTVSISYEDNHYTTGTSSDIVIVNKKKKNLLNDGLWRPGRPQSENQGNRKERRDK